MPEPSDNQCISIFGGILVGGRSSRMGTDKATLTLPTGMSVLEHIASVVGSQCSKVAVSCGQANQYTSIVPDLPRVCDPTEYQGPVAGIVELLKLAHKEGCDGVLAVPVDMVGICELDLEQLRNAYLEDSSIISTASFDGLRSEPLPAIYPASCLSELDSLASCEDRSITRWLKTKPHRKVKLRTEAGARINTPEQWQDFCNRYECD